MNGPRVDLEIVVDGEDALIIRDATCPQELLPEPGVTRAFCFASDFEQTFVVVRVVRK